MTDLTVANTIRDQIGTIAFRLLGAEHLSGDDKSLSFRIRGSRKVNHVKVELDDNDTYTMTFGKLTASTIKKVGNYKVVAKLDQIYADMLNQMIETHTGLYTRF